MKIGAAILAGGQAFRLGGINKGNIKIGNKQSIIKKLLSEFKKIGLTDVIIAANNPTPYLQYQLPIIPDYEQKQGPLAGVISSLHYFANKNYEKVIFVPSDLPNTTDHELFVLKNNIFADSIIYAKTYEQAHPLCVAIPTNKLNAIISIFANGERKAINVWAQLKSIAVEFKNDRNFININTENELKQYSCALVWIISGAGRGVGKTTLANNLSYVLPDSIYAKYGHGKFKPHKQPNFFHDINGVYRFINKYITLKKHIIIEANSLMLTDNGDIKIFIDKPSNIIRPRKDAKELKVAANIVISNQSKEEDWQKILNNYALSTTEQKNILMAFKDFFR